MKLLTKKQAEQYGFRPLTVGYNLPREQWMMDNVLADMRRANVETRFVQEYDGIAIWRKGATSSGESID